MSNLMISNQKFALLVLSTLHRVGFTTCDFMAANVIPMATNPLVAITTNWR